MTPMKARALQGSEMEWKWIKEKKQENKKSGTERKMKCNIFREHEIDQ